MTQFLLCVPGPVTAALSQLELRSVANDDPWLSEVARALFPKESDVRLPRMKNGVAISDLFTEAHNALYNGRELSTTTLESVLMEMMNACESLVLWWGNEWSDLPTVHTQATLLSELKNQLRQPVGDVYLRWERSDELPRPPASGG